MPARHTHVQDVEGGGGGEVHSQGGYVRQADDNTDPLPGLWNRNYCGLDEGTQTTDAWDRACN